MWFVSLLVVSGAVARAAPGPHAAQEAELGATVSHRPLGALPRAPAPPSRTVYGYYPYWGDDPATLPYDRLSHIAIFGVYLESDGTLSSTDTWDTLAAQ